jgi:CubicO group peptidase (beta-lactamase class C family)
MRSSLRIYILFFAFVTTSASAASLDDARDLEAFIDGAAAAFVEAEGASGMTVSVVKNGQVLLAKGYGVATRDTGTPVDAEHTLFRIGSVSKLFLATAIMQLVEQGKLDLDTDLNVYLDGIEIPATFPDPITLHHVMTHTTGLEDSFLDVFVQPEEQRSLLKTLQDFFPKRVRPVGELVAYSNHATALAGLVVEQVSGESYEDYIARHILVPLGMAHTTARQPPPPELASQVSTGDRPADYFTHVGISPAGAISATATDMAKFMIAHLQHGRLGDARILRDDTAQRMQERLFTHDPRVNGSAHQWFERDIAGIRMLGHGGGMVTHITSLVILPEHGVGFFASINSLSRTPHDLRRMFVERYFPQTRMPRPERMKGASDLERFTGWYRESRSGVDHLAKITSFLTMARATADEASRLHFLDQVWVETEPMLFRELDGEHWLLFKADESGEVIRAHRGLLGYSVLLKEPWWAGLYFHIGMASLIVILLLWPFAYGPIFRARRWRNSVRAGGTEAVARVLAALLRVAGLVFWLSFAWGVAVLQQRQGGMAPAMYVAATVPLVLVPLVLASAWYAIRLWREEVGSVRSRLGYLGVVTAAALLIWWAEYWNVLVTRI